MSKYYIWTIGCQMNKAESLKIEEILQLQGYERAANILDAAVVVINSCVVRKNAEDKVMGMLGYLSGIKKNKRIVEIIVTGCFVDSNINDLQKRYKYVDLFFTPGNYASLESWVSAKTNNSDENDRQNNISSTSAGCCALVPIIQGCNNFCSYCIVPYRRGREKSRDLCDIEKEVKDLVKRGVKEVTLLGQNVNSYGNDLQDGSNLNELLTILSGIEELKRIRFLTNHPKDMNDELIRTIAKLPKVCKHLNIPLQSGNDEVLQSMARVYTKDQYIGLIKNIRQHVPDISLSTDIIVGFPNETDEQFHETISVLNQERFDSVHTAMYSTREGTIAAKRFTDNINDQVKKERFNIVEETQKAISSEINALLENQTLSILVESIKNNKYFGRTESDKLVFFESDQNLIGNFIDVKIIRTSPWSLQGKIEVN